MGLPRTSPPRRPVIASVFTHAKKYFAPCDASPVAEAVSRAGNAHNATPRDIVHTAARQAPQRMPVASKLDTGGCARGLYSWAVEAIRARRYSSFRELPIVYRHIMKLSFRSSLSLALISLVMLASCGSRKAPARVPAARIGASEEGIASWYGEPYHGRRAANGEIFDMEQFTAAHPSFPFETWVRVRLLSTNKNTDVRITDRGPFVKGRIIDLSRGAARDLGLLGPGVAKVRVTVIPPPKEYLRGRHFTVQVSSVATKARAEALQRQLSPQYKNVEVRYRSANPKGGHAAAWRVVVGRESSPADSQRTLERLQDKFPNAFIVPWNAE